MRYTSSLPPSHKPSPILPLPPLRFLREPRASPPLCFPPESSSPAKSLAIVHLRPIHRTRSIISTSQGDPSFFPVNPTLHRASRRLPPPRRRPHRGAPLPNVHVDEPPPRKPPYLPLLFPR